MLIIMCIDKKIINRLKSVFLSLLFRIQRIISAYEDDKESSFLVEINDFF